MTKPRQNEMPLTVQELAEWSEVPQELGKRISGFKAPWYNFAAGLILATLSLAGGIAGLYFMLHFLSLAGGENQVPAEKTPIWLPLIVMIAGTTVLFLCAAFFAWLALSIQGKKTIICDRGICTITSTKVESVLFDDLIQVHEIIEAEHFPLHPPMNLLMPMGVSRRLQVFTEEGVFCQFDGNSIDNMKQFKRDLFDRCQRFGTSWHIVKEK